jgi:hypothetical protein
MVVGKKYKIIYKGVGSTRKRESKNTITGVLVEFYEKFLVFQTECWKTCILTSSIKCGEYEVREV